MQQATETYETEKQTVEQVLAGRSKIDTELSKVIVGQKAVIEELLIALFAGGHCLITGAPGLAKTTQILLSPAGAADFYTAAGSAPRLRHHAKGSPARPMAASWLATKAASHQNAASMKP